MPSKPTRAAPYTLPPGNLLRPIVVCGVVMALAAKKDLLAPGSFLHSNLMSLNQSGTALKTASWIQTVIFWFFYGAHTIESAMMAKKLNDVGVSVLSGAWWMWMAECFIGGMLCFEHFDGVVKGKTG